MNSDLFIMNIIALSDLLVLSEEQPSGSRTNFPIWLSYA